MRLIDADKIEVRMPVCLNDSQMKHVAECIKESLHNAPTVDVVTWKDFKDFLDDNAEDFESIDKKLEALTKQVSDLTQVVGRLEGITPPIKSNVPVMFNGTWYNPTVDAIPIEWLEEWGKRWLPNGKIPVVLQYAIEDWREEQSNEEEETAE